MQLVASFLFHSVVAFDSLINSYLCIPNRTYRHKPRQIHTILSFLGKRCEIRTVAWTDDHNETYFFFLFFKYSLKQRANMFLSVISLDLTFNTNILNTCTCLKHIDSALVQPVPVGPYVLSVSCQVKNELYLCIICITFSSHSIYCLVLRLSFC